MIDSPTRDTCQEDPWERCGLPPQPERPGFFPGQQLGPSDLNQIVAWAEARLRLHRWREGWGVACGLDVQVKIVADKPKLVVYPGYAVSRLGEDIVLRRPLCKSLLDFLDLPRLPKCDGKPAPPAEPEDDKPRLVFDVLLRQRDLVADMRCVSPYPPRRPRPARPVRKREAGTIELRKVSLSDVQHPDTFTMEAAAIWAGLGSLAEMSDSDRNQWRDAFAKKIKRTIASRPSPARRRLLKSARSGSMVGDSYVATVAKWLLLWQELRGDPWDACRGLIPLARVLVFADEDEPYGRFEVEDKPPYRRPLGHSTAIPAGATDLRPYLGARWDLNELCLGSLNITKLDFNHPLESLTEERFASVWIDTGAERDREALVALVYDFKDETATCPPGPRILGFFKKSIPAEDMPAPLPEPEPPAEPTPVGPST